MASRWELADALASRDNKNAIRQLFALRLFQLPIDPKLNPPDGKQVKPGFGLASHHLVGDAKLPFPDAWTGCRHGVFDTFIDHAAARCAHASMSGAATIIHAATKERTEPARVANGYWFGPRRVAV